MSNKTFSEQLSQMVVTGFYSGYSPIMPGTSGTLVAALLFYLGTLLLGSSTSGIINILALTLLLFSLIIGTLLLQFLLGKGILSNDKDPQEVVIDEFAGYYLVVLWFTPTILNIILAFVLFRIFDMSKPPPIKQLEKLPGAIGVMADDLGAALPAILILFAINKYFLY